MARDGEQGLDLQITQRKLKRVRDEERAKHAQKKKDEECNLPVIYERSYSTTPEKEDTRGTLTRPDTLAAIPTEVEAGKRRQLTETSGPSGNTKEA